MFLLVMYEIIPRWLVRLLDVVFSFNAFYINLDDLDGQGISEILRCFCLLAMGGCNRQIAEG